MAKIMDATREDFPAILFFCSAKDSYGFALMSARDDEDMPKLMAQITKAMIESPELYSMMKEIIKKVDMEKGVN